MASPAINSAEYCVSIDTGGYGVATRHATDRAIAIAMRTYHRPLNEEPDCKELESWDQVVDRVINHQRWLWERRLGHELNADQAAELEELRQLILDRKIACSGRTLWLGGTELSKRRESCMFNCAYTHLETVYDLVDVLWLLLQGTGVGFRPIPGTLTGFRRPLEKIQVILSTRTDKGGAERNLETFDASTGVWRIAVGDSAVAWALSVGKLVAGKYPARTLILDFSQIRPAGTRLKDYGWISSGCTAISKAYVAIAQILSNRADQLLSRMDILDIVNWLGTILSSRRSAQIALFEYGQPEWSDFAVCKRDWWLHNNGHRTQSNNSLLLWQKPSEAELQHLFKLMVDSGGSEPGIVNGKEALRRAPWFSGVNPCVSKDTWIATSSGYKQVKDLIGAVGLHLVVEGHRFKAESRGFFKTHDRATLYEVTTRRGYTFKITSNHKLMSMHNGADKPPTWIELKDLCPNDTILLANQRAFTHWDGLGGSFKDGWWCGHDSPQLPFSTKYTEERSSEFYKGYTRGAFDSVGAIRIIDEEQGEVMVEFKMDNATVARTLHRMLLRLGVLSTLCVYEPLGAHTAGANKSTISIMSTTEARSLTHFIELAGAVHPKYQAILRRVAIKAAAAHTDDCVEFVDIIDSIRRLENEEEVYDVTVADAHEFAGNGVRMHNCSEVLLCNKGFCNLSEVNLQAFKDKTSLERAIHLAARMNYRQTLVNLKDEILQEAWHLNNQFYRLCGVGLTGITARPELRDYDFKRLKNMAVCGAYSMALELDTPIPKNVTVIKPSGTLSKIMGTTECGETPEGVHKPLGRYIFNNVGFSRHDPIVARFEAAGYDIIEKPGDPETKLIKFPVKYETIQFTSKTVTRADGTTEEVEINDESAVAQLDRYLMMQNSWCEQNTSCTINYSPEEVPAIISWLLRNWDNGYVGTAFMFRADPTKTAKDYGYLYLPQEVICKSTYDEYCARLRPVDYSGIIVENTMCSAESSCVGGVCPVR